MAPIWASMESFVVAHEYAHALHGDLHGRAFVFKQSDTGEDGTPLDLVVALEVLADHPEHLRAMPGIFHELQADFGASDLVAALRQNVAGPAAVLVAPLLFLEFIEMLQLCLLRLACGRGAILPPFTGNPSPAVRKAYLMAQMGRRIGPEVYEVVESTFNEFRKVCAVLLGPVADQMHILWRSNRVFPHPRWRKLVDQMKDANKAEGSTSGTEQSDER
jgi:hypothetical protein